MPPTLVGGCLHFNSLLINMQENQDLCQELFQIPFVPILIQVFNEITIPETTGKKLDYGTVKITRENKHYRESVSVLSHPLKLTPFDGVNLEIYASKADFKAGCYRAYLSAYAGPTDFGSYSGRYIYVIRVTLPKPLYLPNKFSRWISQVANRIANLSAEENPIHEQPYLFKDDVKKAERN